MSILRWFPWDFMDYAGSQVYFLAFTGQYIIDRSGIARTGTSCLRINSGAFGPVFGMPSNPPELYWGSAVYPVAPVANSGIVNFGNPNQAPPNIITSNVSIQMNPNGSILARDATGAQCAISSAGKIQVAAWNYIEVHLNLANGTVECRVNGNTVFSVAGANINANPNTGFQFLSGGGGGDFRHDDGYVLVPSATNGSWLGPVRLYCGPPVADEIPQNFLPAPMFPIVSPMPQQSINASAATGAGNYGMLRYDFSGVDFTNKTILGVQHELFASLDIGALKMGSSYNTSPPPGNVFTDLLSTPRFITGVYDTNPGTHQPFFPPDFAAAWFGPVTGN